MVEAGSNIVYVAMNQVYSRAVMQQSTCHYFPFAFHIYAFSSTTSTVTILRTCPIMHVKLIHLLLFALLKHNTVRIPSCACASMTSSKVTVTQHILPASAHGEFNQPVQKLVTSLVVCLKDFHAHCAGKHSPRPLCSYPS